MSKKIPIWEGLIPLNTGKDKQSLLRVTRKRFKTLRLLSAAMYMKQEQFSAKPEKIDSLTYVWEIARGRAEKQMNDNAYLMPYAVEGSERAVIVIPGGGFSYLSDIEEGEKVALCLNQAGISAFVLYYRVNPYGLAAPQWDLQRAVRYLRFHAAEYGIDASLIGVLGFSAGGYLAASHAIHMKTHPPKPLGYEEDAIDSVSDNVASVGLLYPLVSFRRNPCVLYGCFPDEQVEDDVSRNDLIEQTELKSHVTRQTVPHFICNGTADFMTTPEIIDEYVTALRENDIPCKQVLVEGANHGFGVSKKYSAWIRQYVDWLDTV